MSHSQNIILTFRLIVQIKQT